MVEQIYVAPKKVVSLITLMKTKQSVPAMFWSAICFTILKSKITPLKCSIGSWSNIKQNNEAENAVEALLFGHFANTFAQLPKNSVLVSWLLSPLLSNRFNICSVWQANRCVGTWRTSLCGNTNKPSVFINPAFAAVSPSRSLSFFFLLLITTGLIDAKHLT